jgi:hypothetical protein
MVGVVEGLRRQVVALEIEGSIPSAHPIPFLHTYSNALGFWAR